MIYTFMIPTLIATWGMTGTEAGVIATGALLSSAIGGWIAGILADRLGRVRILQLTVLWFAVFTFLSGFTNSPGQLLLTRTMQGFGFGGEWSVGSVLIAELIRPEHRGKAVGVVQSSWAVGWGVAAAAYAIVYSGLSPELAWRVLFWLGLIPAGLVVFIRRYVNESKIFAETRAQMSSSGGGAGFLEIFAPSLLKTTILASLLATGMQGAYYAVTTWLPTYLKTERNLSVLNTGSYLLVLIVGSFLGYLTSAYLSDRLGRRSCFILFAVAAGVLVILYTQIPITDTVMLFLGFPLGFFLSGIFSGMGAFLSELFPSRVRGSGQGFCYNFGRAVGALFPVLVGYFSKRMPLGEAIGIFAGGAYMIVVAAALMLPETRGKTLVAFG
ncbi:MAG: MFS transporter [Acetobacteraceae bacterium]|nr:MFS transporter [Acetobacteraceae bacterium]